MKHWIQLLFLLIIVVHAEIQEGLVIVLILWILINSI